MTGLGGSRVGYPVTVSERVDAGPAPAPGNADPTPLNITSLTVYRPGRLYSRAGAARGEDATTRTTPWNRLPSRSIKVRRPLSLRRTE